jgi:hypothetical protein
MEWLIPAAMLVLAVLSPALAWWGSTRYFAGQFDAQQIATREWRTGIEKRLDGMDALLQTVSYAAMLERVKRAEQDILDLRQWKHVKADPYIGAVDVLKTRVDSLETRRQESHR